MKSTVKLAAIILAAGQSTRMGRPKMLLPWKESTVLGHLIDQWKSLDAHKIAVVCGLQDQLVAAELDRLAFPPDNRVENPNPADGMFSSIRCAAAAKWSPHLTHFAVILGDQPQIRRETLERLIEFAAAHPAEICQPSCHGHARHPVFLPRSHFLELAGWPGDNLKDYLSDKKIVLCASEDEGLDLDIDTPEDYARARSLHRS